MTFYLATSNPGKLRDFAVAAEQVAGAFGTVAFHTLPGLAGMIAPEEDRDTFEGNARLKAEYYSRQVPGVLVLCDDSGVEVDALGGRPGVRSAYFAEDLGYGGPGSGADQNNIEALLLEMTEQTQRGARYRCVLALARDGEVVETAEGKVEGEILTEPAGEGGFGYDPLFFLPETGCTMAEVPAEQRWRVSHRGRALRTLLARVQSRA